MASTSWDPQGEARAALRTIVSDPQYGAAALSSSQTMTNLLKDLLPDAPREASVLVAASEACLADSLRNYTSQGMDLGTASRLTAGSFENRTALTPEACTWVVSAIATALHLDAASPATPDAPQETGLPGNNQQTMTAGTGAGVTSGKATPAPAGRRERLVRTAALVAAAGAILIIWACALPYIHVPAGAGRQTYSIFNSGSSSGEWFAVEPVGVIILGIAAAVLMLGATRTPSIRWLASGMLVAFGIQTVLSFAGYQFGYPRPDHAGSAGVVGILGALLLLTAGVLGAAGAIKRPAPTSAGPAPLG